MAQVSRRDLLSSSGILLGSTALGLGAAQANAEDQQASPRRKLKIVVVGGHPDDPESGCGGTIARYVDAGHEVVAMYLTRGEAGIKGKSHEETARIRSAEAREACKILGARPVFVGQICSATEINRQRYAEFRKILEAEKPDMVFTHWPIDRHPDHRVASLLTYHTWVYTKVKKFALYYYEVYSGIETQQFAPTDYVDISATEARKRAAVAAHASMGHESIYVRHDIMNRFRGIEFVCEYAEAFVRQVQRPETSVIVGY